MTPLLWLLFIVSLVQYVTSQISMMESGPGIVKPLGTLEMTCTVTGASLIDNSNMYGVNWVRQSEGKPLMWLGVIFHDASTGYTNSLQGRVTLTRDTNKREVFLKLTGMKPEESATYYCARMVGGYFDIWGPGTFVTVTSAQPSAPSVFPMLPCCDSFSSLSEVTIGCFSTGYLPAPVDVTWNSGSITTGIRNPPDILSRNGKYLSASLLTISTSDWKSNKYTCNVDHKATGVKINKDIPECTPDEPISPSAPTVKVLQGSCGETGSVELVCAISGYTPDEIKIQWLLNGKVTSISPTNSTPYKDSEGKFESRSQVSVPKEDWNSGDTYTCRVNHPPSSSKNEDSIHRCSESSTSHPKVVILPPTPKDLLITKEVKVTCIVEKLTSTDSTEFKWKREDGKKIQSFSLEPEEGFDGTYKVKSILKITVADWYSGKRFSCTVSHSDLPAPIEKSITYRDEDVTEPTIYCFQPAPEELSLYDFVGLTCILKQFSHKDVYVQWKKNGVVIDDTNYTTTEPVLDGDGENFLMYTTVLVSKSEWNRGATYTCSGVLKKITSKEIKKNRGK